MSRHLLAFGLLAVGACTLLWADDSPAPAKDDAVIATESKRAVDRVLLVMDVILEHHVSPPTLQEMTLEAARAALLVGRVPVPQAQLAARAARLSTRDDFHDFLEGISRDALRHGNFVEKDLAESLISGALAAASEKPALFTTKSAEIEEQFKGNRYVGIGIALQRQDSDDLTQVNQLLDGPGAEAGLRQGDLLVACDGKSLVGKSIQEVVDLLRGPEGSELILDVRSSGDPSTADKRTLKITRRIIPIKTVQGMSNEGGIADRHRIDAAAPVAYVRLTRIGASAAQELEQLEPQLAANGFQALILDLRSVFSEDLHYAVLLIDALLDQGPIGKVRSASGTKEFVADRDCLFRDWPMAVLVDAGTMGTTEWVAAALQARGRATIIGFETAGEPFVHTFVQVPGTEYSILIPTGRLERDQDGDLTRSRGVRSGGPSEAGSALTRVRNEDEPDSDGWRVIPDHRPEGLPAEARPRRRRAGNPGPAAPVIRPTSTPQSPQAEPLAKESPERDHFITDALKILTGKLRERQAASPD